MQTVQTTPAGKQLRKAVATKPDATLLRQRSLSKAIPLSCAYTNDGTHATENGGLTRTWALSGVTYENVDQQELDADNENLSRFIATLATNRNVAIYQHYAQRKTAVPDLFPHFENDFAREVNDQYMQGLEGSNTYTSELHITIVIQGETLALSLADMRKQRKKQHKQLLNISQQLETALEMYGPVLLGEYQNAQDHTCSEPLEFYNSLLSGQDRPILKPVNMPIDKYLGDALVLVGANTVEIRRASGSRYTTVVEIKDFAGTTSAGVINALQFMDIEYMLSASYCGLGATKAAEKLRSHERYLLSTDKPDMAAEVAVMRAQLEAQYFAVGEVCITLRVTADTMEQVRADTVAVITALDTLGYMAETSGMATDSSYFSALPGNFADRPNINILTSANFAAWCSMQVISMGKPTGNPWGNAFMPLKTETGRIRYMNFHEAINPYDMTGKMLPACGAMIAKTGAGKTTAMCVFLTMAAQYKDLVSVTLDYKQGARATIEAMGGQYAQVKNDISTGYAPFQMDNTPDNCVFLEMLTVHLCSLNHEIVTTDDRHNIGFAVRAVMEYPREVRGISLLLQLLPADDHINSLRSRLSDWARDDGQGNAGPYAWCLDAETNTLDFNNGNSAFGIDGTDMLKNETVKTPVLMFMLHKVKELLYTKGKRSFLMLDEGFEWIDDPIAGPWISQTVAQIRSLDGILLFCTQMPSSVLQSKAGKAIIEQTELFMYSRNPQADWQEYKQFGLTEKEFRYVKGINKHNFLFKQSEESYTGRMDLSGLSPENMAILAGESL